MITKPTPEISSLASLDAHPPHRWRPSAWLMVWACVLLGLMQMAWAGYRLDVGNQGIQIPFLQAIHNPQLYQRDVMVETTLRQYPSWFFTLCAPLLSLTGLQTLYLVLHLLATAGTFFAVVVLSRAVFEETREAHWAALAAVLFLLPGHHPALAGETLYSVGLTHTWAVFPLTLLSLALFFRARYGLAFGLAGVIFNLHALEAAHLAALMGFAAVCDFKRVGARNLFRMAGIFLLMALPTLVLMVRHGPGQFDQQWMELMRVRSADHSFPLSWWEAGSSELPRFACIVALAAVALGFGEKTPQRRTIFLLAAGAGILFVIGTVFTEVWPVSIVVRAQLFRVSRVVLVLALVVIGRACVSAWRMPWRRAEGVSKGAARGEFFSATLTAAALAVPSMWPLLPWAVLVAIVAALVSSRLAWYQAIVAGGAILLCVMAWQLLQFTVPGLSANVTVLGLFTFRGPPPMAWGILLAVIGLWIAAARRDVWKRYVKVLGSLGVAGVAMLVISSLRAAPPADPEWVEVQTWSRDHTPASALFLTPSQQSGFRIFSERAIVGEWRDGTQLYFSPAFTDQWWTSMQLLQPGLKLGPDRRELFYQGKLLPDLDDEQIIALAQHFKAEYVVLPSGRNRQLVMEHDNARWAVYRPEIASAPPARGVDPAVYTDDFMTKVVLPNLEKNRKSDARIEVVDPAGKPLGQARYGLRQFDSAFGMGCSLPFFKAPGAAVDFGSDYQPPAVTAGQLSRVRGLFNYSVIPFSGDWAIMEAKRGAPDYSDLDQYVDWCGKNGVRVEFSFLTGHLPDWLELLNPAEQQRQTIARARALFERYGDRIDSWQVSADRIGDAATPAVFGELRRLAAAGKKTIRLGVADDARFWSPRVGRARETELTRGLEWVRSLKSRSVAVDFFAFEARRPTGLWADAHEMYDTLDAFAKEGVRVHITQLGVPVGARIEGPVRQDRWTAELQARYYEQFFTVCFSHPDVDVINLQALGARSWLEGEGLLDERDQPTPAYLTLQRLITKQWRTEANGALAPDGTAGFRGFHGTYELTMTAGAGKSAAATFTIAPDAVNQFRFQLDAAAGTLTRVEKR